MKVVGKTRMPRTEEGKGGDEESDDDDEDSEEEETDEEDGKLSNKEQQKDKETEDDNDEEEESDEHDNDDDVDKGINTEIFVVQLLVLRSKMTKSLVCYENVDPEPSQV